MAETPKSPNYMGRTERRQTILDAAAELFFEQGFAATSMDAVVTKAGGSKRTLYSHFSSKEELFSAVVTEVAKNLDRAVPKVNSNGATLAESLEQYGLSYLAAALAPDTLALVRCVLAEGKRFPELADRFLELGPQKVANHLAEYLTEYAERSGLPISDPYCSAVQFIGMLRGELHFEALAGKSVDPKGERARKAVKHAVDLFINGLLTARADAKVSRRPTRKAQA